MDPLLTDVRDGLLERLERLDPFPGTAVELITAASDESVEIDTVAELIERDPALVAAVLREANSARFSPVSPAETLHDAVMALGIRGIVHLAVSCLCEEHLIRRVSHPIIALGLWRHSLVTTALARELSSRYNCPVHQATTLAVLHEIGRLALLQVAPEAIVAVAKAVKEGEPLYAVERRILGARGEAFSAEAALCLGLPETLIDLLRRLAKAKPDSEIDSVLRCVNTADGMAQILGYPCFADAPGGELDPAFERMLEMGPTLAVRLAGVAQQAVQGVEEGEEVGVQELSATPERAFMALLHANKSLSKLNAGYESTRRQLERRIDEIGNLVDTFAAVTMGLDEEALRYSILEALIENYQVDVAFMVTSKDGGGLMRGLSFQMDDDVPGFFPLELSLDRMDRPTREALTRGITVAWESGDEGMESVVAVLGGPETVHLCPLMVRGRCHGLLGIAQRRRSNGPRLQVGFLTIVAGATALGFDNARLYSEAIRDATVDPLTGVATRRVILERLEEAALDTSVRPLGVIIADLDHFKRVNDVMGHQAGDRYLKDVTRRMKACLGSQDLFGRYGGDEFLVVSRGRSLDDLVALSEQLRLAVLSVVADRRWEEVRASLGVTTGMTWWDGDATDGVTLIALADSSLYGAKVAGRNRSGQPAVIQTIPE